ncbi:Nicotianamine synthase 1 [Stylosanthes scabra]|uniref:Nicotianamine synthase n=1 Tax=Stylosanthes scabra TaxID=79078 RepID=A0ABU6Q730_9FABA|nr:Nicotianamine synthase 1 [Stylosanthes scabra]
MVCQEQEALVNKVLDLYHKISTLDTLKPSKAVDTLFTQLVHTCIPHTPFIDITKLPTTIQEARSNLIRLCGEAESLLETHYSTLLVSSFSNENPLGHLHVFPYYSNYLKLSRLEFNILSQHFQAVPTKIAFVGSGPLPLTSIVLATNHFSNTTFHNYDIDALANSMAKALVSSDLDLSKRMVFHTTNILDVSHGLDEFNVVFLAALVGMENEEKKKVIDHLGKYMAPGALLMVRSAHGARAFLYPVVDLSSDLEGFEVLSVFHPSDEVINSVVIARKCPIIATASLSTEQGFDGVGSMAMHNKRSEEIQSVFISNNNHYNNGNVIE